MTTTYTTYLSKTIFNKITVKPVRDTLNKCNTCYKCSNKKPKCVCWV